MFYLFRIMRGAVAGMMSSRCSRLGAAALAAGMASWSEAAPIQIMSLGDSVTAGADSSTGAGYRGPLQQMLRDAGIEYDFVGTHQSGPDTFGGMAFDQDHQGYPGFEADDLRLSRLPDHVSSATSLKRKLDEDDIFADLAATGSSPDVILLHIGTNTITSSSSSSDDDTNVNSAHLQLGRLLEYLGTQIDQGYLTAEVTILVARIIPKIAGNTHTAREANYIQTQNYNNAIDDIVDASTIGDRITIVDMFTGLPWGIDTDGDGLIDGPNGNYLNVDGIHPLDDGHLFMAQQWFAAMESLGGVPEPATLMLMLSGSFMLLVRRRRASPAPHAEMNRSDTASQ